MERSFVADGHEISCVRVKRLWSPGYYWRVSLDGEFFSGFATWNDIRSYFKGWDSSNPWKFG